MHENALYYNNHLHSQITSAHFVIKRWQGMCKQNKTKQKKNTDDEEDTELFDMTWINSLTCVQTLHGSMETGEVSSTVRFAQAAKPNAFRLFFFFFFQNTLHSACAPA